MAARPGAFPQTVDPRVGRHLDRRIVVLRGRLKDGFPSAPRPEAVVGPSPGDRARLQGSITVAGQRRILTGFAGTGHWPLASVTTLAGPTWRRGRRCSVRSPESSRSISPRGWVRRGPQLVTGRGAVFRGGVRVACGPHGSCCGVLGRWRSCLGGVWGWVGVGSRARAGLWGRELGLWGRELERLLGDRAWRGEFPPHRRWFAAAAGRLSRRPTGWVSPEFDRWIRWWPGVPARPARRAGTRGQFPGRSPCWAPVGPGEARHQRPSEPGQGPGDRRRVSAQAGGCRRHHPARDKGCGHAADSL